MVRINENYLRLPASYLFSEIARRAREFQAANPDARLMRLGIGNTTEPLAPSVIKGLHDGVEKLAHVETYSGYGDEQGDAALRRRIAEVKYGERGLAIEPDEIFISDGAKSDTANIQSLFDPFAVVAIQDPAYPVYVDTNVIAGRESFVSMACTEANGFVPSVPSIHADIIYICSPNNPTGAVATRANLEAFVAYALANDAIILYDAAYECFIRDRDLPRSIYEIVGARKCAIELGTFSKEAGFTGVRLGWTVVPKGLAIDAKNPRSVNELWNRRQTTFFNGASNVAQSGGLAALTPEGRHENDAIIELYMANGTVIREGLQSVGLTVYGGTNAPYVWAKCPAGYDSWAFFDKMLDEAHVITTPGSGFGPGGEGFLRLSAFGHPESIRRAVDSIRSNVRL
ncbi:MAG: LL-diaminopimelate aminotransferase [Chloroflexota bacterium]|nr:MAG: LL-diaminopimelate aminotransferase [Chloroflexota bacterium]